jgi:hypothetical protein
VVLGASQIYTFILPLLIGSGLNWAIFVICLVIFYCFLCLCTAKTRN